jgi:ATP-binding cassette subfamily B protein
VEARQECAHNALELPPARAMPRSPLAFIALVARGQYRFWLLALVLGEALNAGAGILLPYALNRIISSITSTQVAPHAALHYLKGPLALFATLCAAELVLGRVNSALQLRVAPRQRQYVARALFSYVHRHSHRFLTESFAGALASRIAETALGTNQVLFSLITEFLPTAIVIGVANVLLFSANAWLGWFTGLWTFGFLIVSLLLARRT